MRLLAETHAHPSVALLVAVNNLTNSVFDERLPFKSNIHARALLLAYPTEHTERTAAIASPLDEAHELLLQLALPPRLLQVVDAAQIKHDVSCLAEVDLSGASE